MDILEALNSLDPNDDRHWTTSHLPRLEVLREKLGDDSITRQIVEDSAPGFNRYNLKKTSIDQIEPTTSDDETNDEQKPIAPDVEPTNDTALTGLSPAPSYEDYQQQVEAENDKLIALETEQEVIRKKIEDQKTAISLLAQRVMIDYPPEDPAMAIKRYQEKNLQHRIDQAKRRRTLEQLLNEETGSAAGGRNLIGTSPLDKAMASSTGFGRTRPVITKPG